MSRDLKPREEYDVKEMLREAPNADPQDLDGTIVWYEWVTQNGRQYHLSYWFDDNEYKAAVIEGIEHNELLSRTISSDGMINLKSSSNNLCSGVVETRRRALAILQSLGEVATMNEPRMRIMTIGYSTAGKTFYLASLGKLAIPGAKGFSLQPQDFIKRNEMETLYQIVAKNIEGAIHTTVELKPHLRVLKEGIKPLLKIEITDIEGQALELGRNIDIAEKIINEIGEYDALILLIEAPKTLSECEKRQKELAQLFNFAGEVINKNKLIPITLVLTKIDELEGAKEINLQLQQDLNSFESNLRIQHKAFEQLKREKQSKRGYIVNKYVKQFIDTVSTEEGCAIQQINDTFFNFLRPNDMNIPNKIFPCSSLGFNYFNKKAPNNLDLNSYEKDQIYEPYGSLASFLWTIYAALLNQSQEKLDELINSKSIDSLKNDLLEEIRIFHTSGQAYFDPENNDPQSSIWHIRNISHLRTHQIGL
jgi:predicted DNA binding CopG/RHH family protein